MRCACIPSQVFVKGEPANKRQESRFVPGKILTRYTSSLDQIYGDLKVGSDGLTFTEEGGIDFQPITVLLPGGEEVPFSFSTKDLVATSGGTSLFHQHRFQRHLPHPQLPHQQLPGSQGPWL